MPPHIEQRRQCRQRQRPCLRTVQPQKDDLAGGVKGLQLHTRPGQQRNTQQANIATQTWLPR